MIEHYGINSILDIGAGTWHTISFLKKSCPRLKVAGVEPVQALREVGHQKGLTPEELMDSDG